MIYSDKLGINVIKFQRKIQSFKMNKATLMLIQVLCLAVFVSAGKGLLDINFAKMVL